MPETPILFEPPARWESHQIEQDWDPCGQIVPDSVDVLWRRQLLISKHHQPNRTSKVRFLTLTHTQARCQYHGRPFFRDWFVHSERCCKKGANIYKLFTSARNVVAARIVSNIKQKLQMDAEIFNLVTLVSIVNRSVQLS